MNGRISINKDFSNLSTGHRKMRITVYAENGYGEFVDKLIELEVPAESLTLALAGEFVDCKVKD